MKRVAALLGLAGLATVSPALDFNFSYNGSINPMALAGFQRAGQIWSSLLTDDVTINIQIGYASLSPGVIAQAGATEAVYSYSGYRSALDTDRTSALDDSAVASLETGSSYSFVINGTTNANNANHLASVDRVRMTNANAKAVGLLSGTAAGIDAELTFSSELPFDFDPSDGIDFDKLDFVGVAAHEIGHALGFVSGVEYIDYYSYLGYSDAAFNDYHSSLDLFRYQTFSVGGTLTNLRSYTAGPEAKYFSVDGGLTLGPQFSTGVYEGDGEQASHWKDGLGLGLFGPTIGFGVPGVVSINDLNGLDAIGWNVQAVPEPATMAALGLGALAVLRRRRKA